MANIYLIRHCESEGNACRRTQAQTDALVTAKGVQQNEMLRRRFQDIPISGLYSSDSFRSIMTAQPIARERGLPIHVHIHLREVTTGIWEDMAWGNIARDYPEDHKNWTDHPWDNTTPGASSFQQVADCLLFCLRRIARQVGDGNALCVSHSCTIKAGLCAMMGRPLSDIPIVGHGDNTSVSLIRVDQEGRFDVVYTNDSSHLPPELRRSWSGVAGEDVNMVVDQADLERDGGLLLDMAQAAFWQANPGAPFDREGWMNRARQLTREHPNYLALCFLKGEAKGFVLMDTRPDLPRDCGYIETMYVTPELQGRGFSEQLFGYAAHEFRYGGMRTAAVSLPVLPEDRRLTQRFLFAPMAGRENYLSLELFSPPCPYPVLA